MIKYGSDGGVSEATVGLRVYPASNSVLLTTLVIDLLIYFSRYLS